MTSRAVILASILLTGCGVWPPGGIDFMTTNVVTPDYSFTVNQENELSHDTIVFGQLLTPYLDVLIPHLKESGLLSLSDGDYNNSLDKQVVTVWPVSELFGNQGAWANPYGILVGDLGPVTMLRTYGHELIRLLESSDGEDGLAFQSSWDWSGEMGVLWNIAETDATQLLIDKGML